MKTKNRFLFELFKLARIAAATIFLLALSFQAKGQTYQFSAPVSGSFDLYVGDFDDQSPDSYSETGEGVANFGTLNETVTYNAANQTVDQSGYITLVASTNTITIDETRMINGQTVPGTIVIQQITTGGQFNFDSGPLHTNSNGYYDFGFNSSLQINGTYTVYTGNQVYTGSFDPTISIGTLYPTHFPYDIITFAGNTATLSGEYGNSADGTLPSAGTLQLTASNGFNISLYSGSDSESLHYFSLAFPTSVVATAVPEPSAAGMLGLGGFLILGVGKVKKVLSRFFNGCN